MNMMIPTFSANTIEQISRVLGGAVTGDKIEPILRQCRIVERQAESNTKWRRIRSTLIAQQNNDGCANAVCQFIGLETNTAFSDYIQLYKGDKEMLIHSIQRIKDVSGRILAGLT